MLSATKAVRSATVRIPVEKMDCGNGTMNEHMLKALKAKDAPTIEFTLASYDVAKGAAGVQGTLTGTLSLGGGWFLTPTVLMKGEWVTQQYLDFPTTDIRSGGQFKGFMVEATVAF